MVFKKIDIESKNEIEEYLKCQNYHMCDFAFVSLYMWKEYYQYEYAIIDGMLVIKQVHKNHTYYSFPVGNGNVNRVIDYLLENDDDITIVAVPEGEKEALEKEYYCDIETKDKWYDYLYLANDLRTLSGKKYKSKRNHVNAFNDEYDYAFIPIDDSNKEETIEYIEEFHKKTIYKEDMLEQDRIGSINLVKHLKELDAIGGIIKINDKIVALSIGAVFKDTLYVSVEKANREIRGSYEMINYEFANMAKNVIYINREDDLGDDGIRLAKQSYHPVEWVKKYSINIKGKR